MFFKINQKGLATFISYTFYILISIAVISMIALNANEIINKQQQNYKYKKTIESINQITESIDLVSKNKYNSDNLQLNIPETITIDCENNKILSEITYNNDFEDTTKNGIEIYKKYNQLFFEKEFTNNINLDCENITLNKGKKSLYLNYFDYNIDTQKINIDFIKLNKNYSNFWYNSKWKYRTKLIIDSNNFNQDLKEYSLFLKIKDINLQNPNQDGSNIIFTKKDGKTKLDSNIIGYDNNITQDINFIINTYKINQDENFIIYIYHGNENYSNINDFIIKSNNNQNNFYDVIIGKEGNI